MARPEEVEQLARGARNPRHSAVQVPLDSEDRLAAVGRLRSAVALNFSPGLMWAAGRLGLRDLGNGLRIAQIAPMTRSLPRRACQQFSA